MFKTCLIYKGSSVDFDPIKSLYENQIYNVLTRVVHAHSKCESLNKDYNQWQQ